MMLKLKSFFRVNGLLLLLLGGLLFFKPEMAFRLVVVIFSLEIIISWGIAVFFSWTEKSYRYRGLLFWGALLQVLFGFLLLLFPAFSEFLVKLLIVVIGIVIISRGVILVLASMRAKEQLLSNWRIRFVFGIFAILCGGFLATNAFFSFLLLNILLGLVMMISGFLILMLGFQVKEIKQSEIFESKQ